MKKNTLTVIGIVILVTAGLFYYLTQTTQVTTGGENQNNTEFTIKKDVREAVWEKMSVRQKDEINGAWQDGNVSKVTLTDTRSMRTVGDKSYVGQEVYFVTFPSKYDATLGDVVLYVDINTFDIIGYGLRD